MRFNGWGDTVECEDCGRKISASDDHGYEDIHICPGCTARRCQEHIKKPCLLCGELMGKKDFYWDEDGNVAHSSCVEKLPDDKQEEWYDEY